MNDELTTFKEQVSISTYASTVGYQYDRLKSSKRATILRRETDNAKALVWISSDGYEVFSDLRNGGGGSIIDFVISENKCSLGRARVHLRQFLGESIRPYVSSPFCPKQGLQGATDVDRSAILAAWDAATATREVSYLQSRGLNGSLNDPRFIDTYRLTKHGHVLLSHYDDTGLCGFDIRGGELKRFSTGGTKALWRSNNINIASTIVICEGAIDCLSHSELYGGDYGYVATSGTISANQKALLAKRFKEWHSRHCHIIVATDNDAGGEDLFNQLQSLSSMSLDRLRPVGKDFNDDLQFVFRENA